VVIEIDMFLLDEDLMFPVFYCGVDWWEIF
jgi:hypothetical protein